MIEYPCGCEIEYTEGSDDNVLSINYCRKHEKYKNKNLSLSDNALNLEDKIFEEYDDGMED